MEFFPLTLNDKPTFEKYLKRNLCRLSGASFENIFIWRVLFDIQWAVIEGNFCCFFKNAVGMFMPLPPLGGFDLKTVDRVFQIMEGVNRNKDISRIENIEEGPLDFFKKNHFRAYEKTKEYIVGQKDIAGYRGEKFRHKRNLVNFFKKNYEFFFRDYRQQDKKSVLKLYRFWIEGRAGKNNDPVYQAMLGDGFKAFVELLAHWPDLGMTGKVVECSGEVRAFVCGFPLSKEMFCINFEITDLSFKGLAAFIFSEFAKTISFYPEINIMDDSGIENIRLTKISFRPVKTITSYTALLPL